MKAETFFQKLDAVRSGARNAFGMTDTQVPFDHQLVQDLITLVEAIHHDSNKQPRPATTLPVFENGERNEQVEPFSPPPPPPPSGDGPLTAVVLERTPRIFHPVEVFQADAKTVEGGWQEGDS